MYVLILNYGNFEVFYYKSLKEARKALNETKAIMAVNSANRTALATIAKVHGEENFHF